MTSSIALPRRCLALCSPMHQRMASTMLDLPQPFGPTTPVICSLMLTTARSQNDLKPMISTRLMRMDTPGPGGRSPGADAGLIDPMTLAVLSPGACESGHLRSSPRSRATRWPLRRSTSGPRPSSRSSGSASRPTAVAEVSGQLIDKLTGDGIGGQTVAIKVGERDRHRDHDARRPVPHQCPGPARPPAGRARASGAGPCSSPRVQTSVTDPARAQVAPDHDRGGATRAAIRLIVSATADDAARPAPDRPRDRRSRAAGPRCRRSGRSRPAPRSSLTRALAGGAGARRLRASFSGDRPASPRPPRSRSSCTADDPDRDEAQRDQARVRGRPRSSPARSPTRTARPVARAAVTLVSGDRRLAQGATAEDGTYRFEVEAEIIGQGQFGIQVQSRPGRARTSGRAARSPRSSGSPRPSRCRSRTRSRRSSRPGSRPAASSSRAPSRGAGSAAPRPPPRRPANDGEIEQRRRRAGRRPSPALSRPCAAPATTGSPASSATPCAAGRSPTRVVRLVLGERRARGPDGRRRQLRAREARGRRVARRGRRARPRHRDVRRLDPAPRRAARRPRRSRPGPRARVPALPARRRAGPPGAAAVGHLVAAPDRRPRPVQAAEPGARRAHGLRRGGLLLGAARRGDRAAAGDRAGSSSAIRERTPRAGEPAAAQVRYKAAAMQQTS